MIQNFLSNDNETIGMIVIASLLGLLLLIGAGYAVVRFVIEVVQTPRDENMRHLKAFAAVMAVVLGFWAAILLLAYSPTLIGAAVRFIAETVRG